MALSEQEREWLERRKIPCNRCGFQKRCSWKSENIPCEKWGLFQIKARGTKSGDVEHNFRDAAEFEARVAEKLARNICYNCSDAPEGCPSAFEYPRRTGERCRLMHARLAAEAEMDT